MARMDSLPPDSAAITPWDDPSYELSLEWQRKGATLSDKTARHEFGLTQDEALARTRHGERYVNEQQARAELTRVNREIRRLRAELAELEERQAKLSSDLGI
jgi:hypothetical protein